MHTGTSPFRFGFVALLLAGILTACPTTSGGGSGGATVSAITITGVPSDGNLKMNAPLTLTAVAKDSSGATISGASFTWVSSNPDAVSVDAGGVVTGKKFGKATITVSAGGVSAVTPEQTTYGLEASFGTYVYSSGNFVSDTGTSGLFRFRLKAGKSVPTDTKLDFTTKGPSGWNSGNTDVSSLTTGTGVAPVVTNYFSYSSRLSVVGAYSASVVYAGETFSSQTTTVNPAITLARPTITVSSASTSSVSASWTAVPAALGYYLGVNNNTDNSSAGYSPDSPNLSATITGLALDPAKSPAVFVYSWNVDLVNLETTAFPANANSSGTGKFITIPTP